MYQTLVLYAACMHRIEPPRAIWRFEYHSCIVTFFRGSNFWFSMLSQLVQFGCSELIFIFPAPWNSKSTGLFFSSSRDILLFPRLLEERENAIIRNFANCLPEWTTFHRPSTWVVVTTFWARLDSSGNWRAPLSLPAGSNRAVPLSWERTCNSGALSELAMVR